MISIYYLAYSSSYEIGESHCLKTPVNKKNHLLTYLSKNTGYKELSYMEYWLIFLFMDLRIKL